jgi:hypothetical protein
MFFKRDLIAFYKQTILVSSLVSWTIHMVLTPYSSTTCSFNLSIFFPETAARGRHLE